MTQSTGRVAQDRVGLPLVSGRVLLLAAKGRAARVLALACPRNYFPDPVPASSDPRCHLAAERRTGSGTVSCPRNYHPDPGRVAR
jgi:hypothetical protein